MHPLCYVERSPQRFAAKTHSILANKETAENHQKFLIDGFWMSLQFLSFARVFPNKFHKVSTDIPNLFHRHFCFFHNLSRKHKHLT